MKFLSEIFFMLLVLVACNNGKERSSAAIPGKKKTIKHVVAILPFKKMDTKVVGDLQTDIGKKLKVDIVLLKETDLPISAFYTPRQRYIADSLLAFLRRQNKGQYEKIIGVTHKDISTRKGDNPNWGILGLGSCPGEACVISSFRAGRNKIIPRDFRRRMVTLALHELGHTYGLEHCPADTCLMKDAEGKMNLDDGENYCIACRNWLSRIGILK